MPAISACLFLLIAAFALLSAALPARAVDFPGQAHVVQGVVTTKNGQPLADATIYVSGVPSNIGTGQDFDATITPLRVTTDAQGHFTWNVPADVTVIPDLYNPLDCSVVAPQASDWTLHLEMTPFNTANFMELQILQATVQTCQTRWIQKGANPILGVVAPDMSRVNLTVFGPDAKPLRDHALEVLMPPQFNMSGGQAVYAGRTDNFGRASVRWFPGLGQMAVFAPGVGFGATGTLELLPNQTRAPALPPLAAFATVSGTLAPGIHAGGATVALNPIAMPAYPWYQPKAALDAQGLWTLSGVLPGPQWIILQQGAPRSSPLAQASVTVAPGETVTGVTLQAPKPPSPAEAALLKQFNSKSKSVPGPQSVSGTVTDIHGQGIAGTMVSAICDVNIRGGYDGFRPNPTLLTTTTDPQGHYAIPGLPTGIQSGSIQMVVDNSDYAPAKVTPQPVHPADPASSDFHADIVLAPPDTGLTVHVTQDGKPIVGATVTLHRGNDPRYMPLFSPQAFPDPATGTDADGLAKFQRLSPGLWHVTAGIGEIPGQIRVTEPALPRANAYGVIVQAGRTTNFTLALPPQPAEIPIRVVGPDGQPPSNSAVIVQYSQAAQPINPATLSGASATVDAAGNGSMSLPTPGLWRITARWRDLPMNGYTVNGEPYYSAEAVVAVSPSVAPPGRILLRAARIGPGSIHVQMENAEGKPVRGAVTIDGPYATRLGYAASSDTQGRILFSDIPSGKYTLTPSLPGLAPLPALGADGDPMPPDSALTNVRLLAPQAITVTSDTETAVPIRPQLQGYIRGRIVGAALTANDDLYEPGYTPVEPKTHLNPATGEFLIGPFPPGQATLELTQNKPNGQNIARWDADAAVVSGHVTHVTLSLPGSAGAPARAITLTSERPFSQTANQTPLMATVTLADGITPAWGARVALLGPHSGWPVQMARADALGHLTEPDAWDYNAGLPASATPADQPAQPVLVAWLPGACGAATVPYVPGQAAQISLPTPISDTGRVTVGGQSVAGLASEFRVLAAFQGHGALDPLLSLDLTPSADGAFTLAGLSPGTYLVQASRDGIWFSPAQTLTVAFGQPPSPLTLDIPAPGQPVQLEIRDPSAHPLPGATVSVDAVSGPLATLLWPPLLTADRAGDLLLEGLPVGPLRLTITPAPPSRASLWQMGLTIPPLVPGVPPLPMTATW